MSRRRAVADAPVEDAFTALAAVEALALDEAEAAAWGAFWATRLAVRRDPRYTAAVCEFHTRRPDEPGVQKLLSRAAHSAEHRAMTAFLDTNPGAAHLGGGYMPSAPPVRYVGPPRADHAWEQEVASSPWHRAFVLGFEGPSW